MSDDLKIGDEAPDFNLPGVDGKNYSLADFEDKKVVTVMFSCNHCPYVQAYEDRIMAIQEEYEDKGVVIIAINSNSDSNYPEDSFANMVKRAKFKGFNFPYLRDESQSVALAYRASHTPQIFVFDHERKLRYTGKIDDNWREARSVKAHYLRDALSALVNGEEIKMPDTYAIGCTIKWR